MNTSSVLHVGDCRDVIRHAILKDHFESSFDAVITDPPYELGFMGKAWDKTGVSFDPATWELAYRLLKPGGHLLAFGGARTYHRIACAIEDAGFEIRDQIMWLYGSGFPKSKNLEDDWDGWGTALKPAHEPIVVARKPFEGTVADNVLQHGVGALNIDACRIAVNDGEQYTRNCSGNRGHAGTREQDGATSLRPGGGSASALGRWPANVCHDGSEEVVAGFPAQAGAVAPVHTRNADKFRTSYGAFAGNIDEAGSTFHGDSGSAARFFYCAKAARNERNAGLEGFEKKPLNWSSGEQNPGAFQSEGTDRMVENHHPTVKPIALMRWLCRLVTPPGGTVVDLFMGSGSTGCAAALEGFDFIGIEKRQDYHDIAKARIRYWMQVAEQEIIVPQMDLFA